MEEGSKVKFHFTAVRFVVSSEPAASEALMFILHNPPPYLSRIG